MNLMEEVANMLREDGMTRAINHACRVEPSWADRAHEFLCAYARKRHHFQSEHVRMFAKQQGLPDPPDGRTWGTIMREGAKQGVIEATHYAPSFSPQSHARPMMVWKSRLYEE